ncbi:hypothetical protein SD70_27665 [Gordoniibacillus kamchatkensis]|uniref:YhaN AAA domain-containing protein n=1 Tax=Gordoniibacillus kamchatkensis TaxID=1590651 RepID=A0ABR5AB50_9BACL|nr:AAA family ATPase [Paenibacillus sp. VKM B-2647]KIL38254.1 hypothetical protein SD70_27665 [Paenibacillus sp. VKM B-2647]
MRLTRIQVDGFGALRDASFELEGTLTVVYGRNEAGKSTLMNFVRYVLFGFPSRASGAPRYEPAGAGLHGGALGVVDGAGNFGVWNVMKAPAGGAAAKARCASWRLTAPPAASRCWPACSAG